ncbi:FAD/NAD(P)-binding domain containing protein, partial [Trema orientale]
MRRSVSVALIGAGVPGLCAAHELKTEGQRVRTNSVARGVRPAQSRPGSRDRLRQPLPSSAHQPPQTAHGILGLPILETRKWGPENVPAVLWFLNKFAREFGLVELTRFNAEVVRVMSRESFEAVVVCTRNF